MCLIAYSPKGTIIDRAILAYAYNQNGDGIGVMSVSGIEKFMGHKALKRARRYIETYLVPDETPFAIHFRWATHGAIQMSNTHPYETPDGLHWVMHNGVISMTTQESTDEESDTAVYVRKHMAEVAPFYDIAYWRKIENQIGWGNKLCVMDANGAFKLCHEDAGTWIDGIWFSNTYSLPSEKIPTRGYSYGREYYGTQGRSYEDWRDYVPYVSAQIWDAQSGKFVPNPAYKAEEDKYSPSYKPVEPRGTGGTRTTTESGITVLHRLEDKRSELDRKERWTEEDRTAYYAELETSMKRVTGSTEAEYYDEGTDASPMSPEDKALRLAEAEGMALEKEPANIGGDFSDPDDDEEQSRFRRYLKKVAAGIYVS